MQLITCSCVFGMQCCVLGAMLGAQTGGFNVKIMAVDVCFLIPAMASTQWNII